jgi:hypothetical protein
VKDNANKSHSSVKNLYDTRYSFAGIIVWYVDRGALGDCSSAKGSMITIVPDQYLEIATPHGTKCIPHQWL